MLFKMSLPVLTEEFIIIAPPTIAKSQNKVQGLMANLVVNK